MSPLPIALKPTELPDWSLRDPRAFWAEQAKAIDWHRPFDEVFELSRPPFSKWFPGGTTNLCHNALDRHLASRGEQTAIVYLSTETGEERKLTYLELHREVLRMAALFRSLGLAKGDRVALYLPVIPEAAIAMLACARLGLIHSVVFAGFAAESLARRIEDADARLVITCDGALRNGKLIRLKRTVDEAIAISQSDAKVLVINRHIDPEAGFNSARDIDYADWTETGEAVPCIWLESSEPSYVLYTSGTTAKPKGVQRDVGGYAVALVASLRHIFGCEPGETYFSTADVGWVVGHSYSVYGPLMHGMTTILFEGVPIHENGEIWWKIVEQTRASVMFASPTAMRILKKCESAAIGKYDLSSLRRLFLAGEPLDQPTSAWAAKILRHVQIADNYWQTETGWPILSQSPGCGRVAPKAGSPGVPVYGYDVYVADEHTGEPLPRGERGVIALRLPLPPGCFSTVWKQDSLFENHYFGQFPGTQVYSTFDYAVQDEDGHYFILGRTDDVINVAGHRIGTREIEETICTHPDVAEAATVGVADEIRGQVIKCFVVLKSTDPNLEAAKEIEERIVGKLGSIARPAFVGIVQQLPKTRSGKIMRRAIQAISEGREPGDLSTLEEPASLDYIRESLEHQRDNMPSPGKLFRGAVEAERPLQIVGTINAYCAMLAERAGFRALYLSGAGVANASFGLPDLGVTTLNDVCEEIRRITQATKLPLLVDADTGWGGAFMIARTIREMSRAGAAGCHIEDQVQAKRCGHRPGKKLVSAAEMCDRIKAATDARQDADFVIMARTDGCAVEGLEAAIDRSLAYVNAGADMIFAEALGSLEEYSKFVRGLGDVPVLANITEFGKTPLFTIEELRGAGLRLVLYPLSAFRAMSKAAENVYGTIRREGTQQNAVPLMQTRAELYDVLQYHAYEDKLDTLFSREEKS